MRILRWKEILAGLNQRYDIPETAVGHRYSRAGLRSEHKLWVVALGPQIRSARAHFFGSKLASKHYVRRDPGAWRSGRQDVGVYAN